VKDKWLLKLTPRFFILVTFTSVLFASQKTGSVLTSILLEICMQYDLQPDMGSCQVLAQFLIDSKFVNKISDPSYSSPMPTYANIFGIETLSNAFAKSMYAIKVSDLTSIF